MVHLQLSVPTPPSPQCQPSLLRLPYMVRREIYAWLGFFRHAWVYLNIEPIGEWSPREQKVRHWQELPVRCSLTCRRCVPLANQLFYVSRAVSEDARAMLYSGNKFSISDSGRRGLGALLNLGPVALRSLRLIEITISTQGCSPDGSFCHGSISEIMEIDNQLRNSSTISDWKQICAKLAAHVQENRLRFRLCCGAATKETAEAFLNPLLELPRLMECSIWLAPYENVALQYLVAKTVRDLTQSDVEPSKVFQFSALPLEIQLRILEHTDLVASSPLIWSKIWCCYQPRGCLSGRCGAWEAFRNSRCCATTHTTFSSVFRCRGIAYGLFQVSKALKERAERIFYSQNTFVLRLDECLPKHRENEHWTFSRSPLLTFLPVDHLQYIRYIDLELDESSISAFISGPPKDFTKSIEFISDAIPPSTLTLTLSIREEGVDEYDAESLDDDSESFVKEMEEEVEAKLSAYEIVVQPIARMRPLKDFFVHISWSTSHREILGKWEQKLERQVMGDHYDSKARGKVPTE